MAKLKKQSIGGFIDKSLNSKAEELITSFSSDKILLTKFRQLIGVYRFWKQIRETEIAKHQISNEVGKIIKSLDSLHSSVDRLPVSISDLWASQRSLLGYNYIKAHSFFDNLKIQLKKYSENFEDLAFFIDEVPEKRGEKKKYHEKLLLSNASELIERTKPNFGLMNSAELASKILTACGVHNIPHDKKKAREAIKKYRDELDRYARPTIDIRNSNN